MKSFKFLIALLLALVIVGALSSCAEVTLTRSEEYAMTEALDKLNDDAGKQANIIVSFPGIGIEPVVISKIAMSVGAIHVSWYGIIMIIASVIAIFSFVLLSKREKIKFDDTLDVFLWTIFGAIIGARAYYVINTLDRFKGKPFLNVFKFWDGGLAIYGAILGGILAVLIVSAVKKIRALKSLDTMCPGVLLAQAVGRIGDFVNGQSYGYELHEGNIMYNLRMGVYPHLGSNSGIEANDSAFAYVHPTFLYESVWNLLGAILLFILWKKKKFDGQIFYIYMVWYGLGRTVIELLRTDSLEILGVIRVSALVGCVCLFGGAALLIYRAIEGKKERLATESYQSTYPLFRTDSSSVSVDDNSEKSVNIEKGDLKK